MKLKTPVNKTILRHHIAYNFWKYILLVVFSVFIVDMLYTTTAYRVPESKRIDVYIQGTLSTQEHIDQLFERMRTDLLPEVEVIRSAFLLSDSQNEMYAAQQLTTYLAVGEGDLYILQAEDYKRYASQGVFADLGVAIDEGQLDVLDLDLSGGFVAMQEYDAEKNALNTIGEKRLYGIPTAGLPGLNSEFGIINQNSYISMTVFNGNDVKVLSFLNSLIGRTYEEKEVVPATTQGNHP